MFILNFSHPLTAAQRAQIEALAGATGDGGIEMIDMPVQFDEQQPFAAQVRALVDGVQLTPAQWQGEAVLVVLPSLNFIAALLLAELHGRMGYFPTVVRTRPVAGAAVRSYEVAEMIDLQAVRDAARRTRA